MPILAPTVHRASNSEVRGWPLAIALLAALLIWLGQGAARAEAVPIPPPPERWVTDVSGLLSPATRAKLDAKLESYERNTGHQIVVYIRDSIGESPLDEFAVKTFEAWRLGRKGADDGLLLIVLARDRKLAIEVGYGLEDRVPDAAASRIIHEVIAPKLRAGDPDGAIEAGVDAILANIEGKPFAGEPSTGPISREPPRPSAGKLLLFGLLAVGFLILFITNPGLALSLLYVVASGRHHGRGGGGWGGGGFAGGGGRSGGGGARGSW